MFKVWMQMNLYDPLGADVCMRTMSCFGFSIPVALILMTSKIGKVVLKDYIDDYGLLEDSLNYEIVCNFGDLGCSFRKRKNICYMVDSLLDDGKELF
ncbi:hypothetical protein SLEP1_g47627 [Rubroshorea leprosula]|uniref:Uncharacterized protein n=1 Tax=Rubroshorea leprosula TaxID=152421 RepID=A0AAV5LT24_9ROSI|nr:hypothetical protein SLEP1_g47627 [Rubroshorea leprosula]